MRVLIRQTLNDELKFVGAQIKITNNQGLTKIIRGVSWSEMPDPSIPGGLISTWVKSNAFKIQAYINNNDPRRNFTATYESKAVNTPLPLSCIF